MSKIKQRVSRLPSARPGEVNGPVRKAILYIVLAVGSIIFLAPFFWMLSTTFKKPGVVYLLPIEWIPKNPTLENFKRLFAEYSFQKYLLNSTWLTAINLIGYLSSCTLVAYAFATQRWKYKNQLFLLVLATMMLPKEVVFYPRFILFRAAGLYGTTLPLWLPSFFGDAFQIFLMRQFFLGVPTELNEAAKIDGCGRFKTFWNIYIPLSKPALASSAIFIFMFHWNDFFGPLIYITKEAQRTSALALMYLKSEYSSANSMIPIQMTAALVTAIPCLLLYYFCQQYFIAGLINKNVEK
jgi:ABC-type glycerol-3-phosphate transport system permease component